MVLRRVAAQFDMMLHWGAHLVRFENVGLRYGMGSEVLKDVTFGIEPRSFQFLTGPSGSGKTTLLRLLFLSLKPTRGLITLFGRDVSSLSPDEVAAMRQRIGIVFQDFRLLDHLTTYENVSLPLRVAGKEEASYRAEVTELLHWVGLGERRDVLPLCSPAARSSAPPLPVRSSAGLNSCWPMSPPAMWTRHWRAACCGCSSNSTRPEHPCCWPPMTSPSWTSMTPDAS